ncbi:rRNA maturation RNase YbeY [Candidatus Kaiserbacteria bacterium RIFCSPHIGHO2_01_FULL_54_36b]|uniref:Endoribonuclease YbeY n=1 Tax=Candidatus Kaiserbacteria bacterium RIFCSPHIGHO2_01_FULL_54_36b TaxID=1798483 RepID=A0A1F6CRE8_9BACT|nr:MAG: rRNA maturation RNase YbeY [Candidatus Kaiserbacteria bacterium RIFCSPHIGHO2_01_FULL_54_36b]
MSSTVSIKKTLRGPIPKIPFERMARAVLGRRFELSLVVCGDDLAQRINREHRKKDYKPNVLSFPLSKTEGEIFLNVREAAREARRLKVSLRDRLALLFVHGCFHLKGLSHGRIMEGQEQRILRAFHFSCNGQYTQE